MGLSWRSCGQFGGKSSSHCLQHYFFCSTFKAQKQKQSLNEKPKISIETGIHQKQAVVKFGHKGLRTAEIYTHVSQKDLQIFKNPFDDAFFDDG
jgi:hypothetical protein